MKGSLLVRNIRYLVTCDDHDLVLENADLYVRDGVIAGISESAGTPDEWKAAENVLDASGMVMYPGLINTHHHLYQTFSRNLPQVQGMELFPWLKALYEIWKNLDSDFVYYSSMTGLGELLKNGCTTCLDHHYVFPAGREGLLDAEFSAAEELGMRFYGTRGSMDLSVKDGGLPPDSVVQDIDTILRDTEDAVRKFHDPSPYSMHLLAAAPCSPFSVSGRLLEETAVQARKLGIRLHTHLAETKDEEKYTLAKYHMRPLAYMESLGWIGRDVWFAHGIHFNDEELDLLAKTGTGVAHCPISNMKLSSGIARIPDMLEKGVPVGLAVDGSASNDGSNLLEEMRTAYLLHRLNSGRRAPSAYDLLKIATRGSAGILGRDKLGFLETGMAADFFLVSLSRLELVGAQFDPKSMLGTVGLKGPVDYTAVNGEIVVSERRLVKVEEEKLVPKANAAVERYIAMNE